jgi:hypothetical protein
MQRTRSVGVVWLFVLGLLAFAAVVTPSVQSVHVPGIVAGDDSKPGAGGG